MCRTRELGGNQPVVRPWAYGFVTPWEQESSLVALSPLFPEHTKVRTLGLAAVTVDGGDATGWDGAATIYGLVLRLDRWAHSMFILPVYHLSYARFRQF
jgi:hypothetical protein